MAAFCPARRIRLAATGEDQLVAEKPRPTNTLNAGRNVAVAHLVVCAHLRAPHGSFKICEGRPVTVEMEDRHPLFDRNKDSRPAGQLGSNNFRNQV